MCGSRSPYSCTAYQPVRLEKLRKANMRPKIVLKIYLFHLSRKPVTVLVVSEIFFYFYEYSIFQFQN